MLGDVRIGPGQQDPQIGVVCARAPHLLSVDHPLVAVPLGPRGQAGQVRTGAWFAEQLAPHLLAPQHGRQVAAALFVGAVPDDGGAGHTDPDGEQTRSHVETGLFLTEDHRLDERATLAAELDRPGDAGPAAVVEAALPFLSLGDEDVVEVVERMAGRELPRFTLASVDLQPGPHVLAECRLFLAVVEVHRSSLSLVLQPDRGRQNGRPTSSAALISTTSRSMSTRSCSTSQSMMLLIIRTPSSSSTMPTA